MNATLTTMQLHADNYLSERRRLGFSLRSTGYAVKSFARHIDDLGHQGPLTVEVMADWARRDKGNSDKPATWARRLAKIRMFAQYLRQFEPNTEVPDDTTFGRFGQRMAPHIYSDQEIVDLLAAARRLGPAQGLRGATYETLFGLIASTGLRVSEAVHLLDADVDLKSGILTIRRTKFAKSRQVPMHTSTVDALRRYHALRNLHVKNQRRYAVLCQHARAPSGVWSEPTPGTSGLCRLARSIGLAKPRCSGWSTHSPAEAHIHCPSRDALACPER